MAIPDRAGRYRFVRLLGTGGTSSVFVAHDPDLDVDVAVKVLADNLARREDVVARFVREARLLREVADPHVVGVHDVGLLDSGQPYFVMDLVEGGTLAGRLAALEAAGWRAPAADVLAVGRALAVAVAAVHRRGLVHGDVKPENLYVRAARGGVGAPGLLPEGATLVLGDFGLAGFGGDAGGGTEGYVAPEQRRGEPTDTRADLYSCSAVVFRLLEGRPPPAAAGPGGLPGAAPRVSGGQGRGSRGPGRGPGGFGPADRVRAADRRFDGFFTAGLAPDPADRPADADAWLHLLEEAARRRRPLGSIFPRRGVLIGGLAVLAAGWATLALLSAWSGTAAPSDPVGLAFDDERVVVSDGNGRVVASRGGGGWDLLGRVDGPAGVAVTAGGRILVAQPARDRVLVVGSGGVRPLALGGSDGGGSDGGGSDGGDPVGGEPVEFDRPVAVAVGTEGEVYVVDAGAHRVMAVRGGTITPRAGSGRPGDGSDLRDPSGAAVGPDGTLYVADTGNHRVVEVDRGGTVSTVAGTGSPGFGGDGGPAASAQLSEPSAVAVGDDGTVYVADTGNHRLRAVAPDGTITTLAGTGRAGSGEGLAARTALDGPRAVAVVEAGEGTEVYLADARGVHVVRHGELTTLR